MDITMLRTLAIDALTRISAAKTDAEILGAVAWIALSLVSQLK